MSEHRRGQQCDEHAIVCNKCLIPDGQLHRFNPILCRSGQPFHANFNRISSGSNKSLVPTRSKSPHTIKSVLFTNENRRQSRTVDRHAELARLSPILRSPFAWWWSDCPFFIFFHKWDVFKFQFSYTCRTVAPKSARFSDLCKCNDGADYFMSDDEIFDSDAKESFASN